MLGSCRCNNLQVDWQIKDFSLVPKACQCDYCTSKNAAYVAKPGSKFSLTVKHNNQYRPHQNGRPSPNNEPSAVFHECLNCKDLVAVTCEIGGVNYGLINVHTLKQRERFPAVKAYPFVDQELSVRLHARQQNWSSPVTVNVCDKKPEHQLVPAQKGTP